MNEPRIIKKYPNRRLYDTTISSYITLEDVRRLIVDQVSIKVVDARTQEDITHNTLMQIIIEQEENGPPLFTTNILQQMIRFYGGSMQELLSKMFEQGMEFFAEQQPLLNKDLKENHEPINMMTELAKKNLAQWQQLQNQWVNSYMSNLKNAKETENASSHSPPDTE